MEINSKDKLKKIQSDLSSNKNLVRCDVETLKYATKPIGKAILKSRNKNNEENETPKYSDRITCDICGKEFGRSNYSAHKKTKQHKLYAELGEKVKKILLD